MKHIAQKINSPEGMTLIEVLIAMIIMAFGMLALAPLVMLSIEGNDISRDVMMATALAKERIELYQVPDSIPALPYDVTEEDLSGLYDRTTRIWDNATDTLMPAGIAAVQIDISWTDKMGTPRSYQYVTYVNKG